ncbi:MAG: hypothetical protein QOE23_4 [Pseudonocardiales bacterium]|jgi:uncharacterized protein YbaR (Trm112 family)|nr:hypothetical protein [Pseudonocardiales bacterium]
MTIDPELLEVLACPKDQAGLIHSSVDATLTCSLCATRYPVRDGIPVLLPDAGQSTLSDSSLH